VHGFNGTSNVCKVSKPEDAISVPLGKCKYAFSSTNICYKVYTRQLCSVFPNCTKMSNNEQVMKPSQIPYLNLQSSWLETRHMSSVQCHVSTKPTPPRQKHVVCFMQASAISLFPISTFHLCARLRDPLYVSHVAQVHLDPVSLVTHIHIPPTYLLARLARLTNRCFTFQRFKQ
jgi:hypothetical protein